MSVQLFVEKLNQDKTIGITTNHAMMFENASKFRIQGIEKTADIVGLIFEAGRYVAAVIMDANNELGMMFMDLKKDRQKALSVASQFKGEAKDIFMKNFEEVTKNYEANYNLVELVVDKSFPTNILAN
jgi:hypothetical protein